MPSYQRLGDLFVSAGLISPAQLGEALEEQKRTRKRLGDVLIEKGFVTEQQKIQALEAQLGIDSIDLLLTRPAPEMAQLLPQALARRHLVIPVRVQGDELYLAMVDPLDFVAIEEVKKLTRKRVIPMITARQGMDRAISTLYGAEGAARAIEELCMETPALSMGAPTAGQINTISDDPQSAPTIRLVNSILERAMAERASDIHFEPREAEMVVRLRIDGALRIMFRIPATAQASVISRLKVMGSMDIAERKIPQDGRANIRLKDHDVDLRISTLPTVYGEKMVIRLLDKSAANLGRSGIGLTGASLERYEQLLRNSSGVILIAGPTGSGKSSTMYTMIQELNTEDVNLVTLEDPVEFNTDGVNQCQINEKTGMTFANGLRSILRQDPDIIAVGEIRDGETASIAMRAAITGHLVLSTIHTNDSIATVDRLLDIGVEPYLISTALKGVIAQRLVRRICPRCKEQYRPSEDELSMIGLRPEPGLLLCRGHGCPECFGTGYRGRAAVFEILVVDNTVRKLIAQKADRDVILRALSGTTFLSLADYSRNLVRSGVTTVSEAARTIYSTVAE